MDKRQIHRFFQALARELTFPATVVLTGAAAGTLWGSLRPSQDIDFAIWPARKDTASWQKIERAVDRAVKITGVAANFAEDIDRWSSVTLLDYRRHTRPYRRFGVIRVRLLDPAYWSIGKIARFLPTDIRDLVTVLTKENVSYQRLARIWGKALRASPPSTACFQFRRQAEEFLSRYGRAIWGRRFDPKEAIQAFYRPAGIRI